MVSLSIQSNEALKIFTLIFSISHKRYRKLIMSNNYKFEPSISNCLIFRQCYVGQKNSVRWPVICQLHGVHYCRHVLSDTTKYLMNIIPWYWRLVKLCWLSLLPKPWFVLNFCLWMWTSCHVLSWFSSSLSIGLLGCSLQNTGHWQFQRLWHKILSYLHVHCPFLLSFLYRTKSQNTGQSG